MRRVIVLFLLLAIPLYSACCGTEKSDHNFEKIETDYIDGNIQGFPEDDLGVKNQGSICVNGEELEYDEHIRVVHQGRYAEIPLIAVMDALGADLEWKDDESLRINYRGKVFVLDISHGTLKDDDNSNYIVPPPGTEHGLCVFRTENDYYVDTDSLFLFFKEIEVDIKIDYENSIIHILS